MTEEQMNRLADIIVDKIIERQQQYDKEFKEELKELAQQNPDIEFGTITQKELIEEELNNLYQDLKELEEKEDYAAASRLLIVIEKYKKKYNIK